MTRFFFWDVKADDDDNDDNFFFIRRFDAISWFFKIAVIVFLVKFLFFDRTSFVLKTTSVTENIARKTVLWSYFFSISLIAFSFHAVSHFLWYCIFIFFEREFSLFAQFQLINNLSISSMRNWWIIVDVFRRLSNQKLRFFIFNNRSVYC